MHDIADFFGHTRARTLSFGILIFTLPMNPETAFVLCALMMLANGAVLGLVHRDLLPSLRPSAVSWRIGTLLVACGCLLVLARGYAFAGFIVTLANGLILLGFTGYWRALRQFYGLPERLWLILPALAGCLLTFWFSVMQPSLAIRSLLVTVCWLVIFVGCSATLLSRRLTDNALSRRVLAGIFLLVSGFALLRLAIFLIPGDAPIANVLDGSNWINVVTPMIAGLVPVVGTTAFLLMCSERLRRQWEEAASTDYLTGLANRRTLAEAGERRFRETLANGQQLSVAVIDIDHFKSINDRYGHEVGDRALKHVAATLARHCRADELPGRQGGEEFVVVMQLDDPETERIAGERLRQAVENQPFVAGDMQLPLTVSIGIAHQRHGDLSFDQVLGRADAALYTAKANGRNRVEIAA